MNLGVQYKRKKNVVAMNFEITRFDLIGDNYELAMKRYPATRTDEVWVMNELNLRENDKVLELAAGAGYLTQKMLPVITNGEIVSQDISNVMLELNRVNCKRHKNVFFYLENDMDLPNLRDGYFDKAVCLGGFHHMEEPVTVLRAVKQKLKNGGVTCIGDFADNSPVQKYFDERVNLLTIDGHQGLFLTESRMINLGRLARLQVSKIALEKVPFYFDNRNEVGEFYQLVHGLDQDPKDTVNDIEKYMGIIEQNNKCFVPMDYIYVKYTKV